MKIAYLVYWTSATGRGVAKKILGQIGAWEEHGHSVELIVLAKENDRQSAPPELLNKGTFFWTKGVVDRLATWWRLDRFVQADLLYFRYDLYMPGMEKVFRKVPTVVEINTNDVREFCLKPSLRCWYNRLFRDRIMTLAAGFVAVTGELGEMVSPFGKPVAVIANGIDLRQFPILPPNELPVPSLVFLGTPGQPWHGLAAIRRLADIFPSWQFHIVGYDGQPGFPVNVSFHGYLSEEQYRPILAQVDVALGTLALERKGMREGAPLKVREYLAHGLPAIIGYRDTDFPEGAEFLLQIQGADISQSILQIKAFVERWKGKRVPRELVAHLDWRVKEGKRLEFFTKILTNEKGKSYAPK
jgi:glycosyltransferase involved in cell wall biosynthesis